MKETEDRQNRVMTMEEAFEKIRDATGIESPDEMVEKFMLQGKSFIQHCHEKKEKQSQIKCNSIVICLHYLFFLFLKILGISLIFILFIIYY